MLEGLHEIRNRKSRIGAVLIIVWVLGSVACADRGDGRDDPIQAQRSPIADANDDQTGPAEEDGAEKVREDVPPYWGAIQYRADDAFKALEDEILGCLEHLGDSEEVRMITLLARRDDRFGAPYEVSEVTTRPAGGIEQSCVEEISEKFVQTLGPGVWDDFQVYMASFVHRGEVGGECEDEGVDDALCVDIGDVEGADGVADEDTPSCAAPFVDAVQQVISATRDCPQEIGLIGPLPDEFREAPYRMRALVFGDLRVEEGVARVVLRHNAPFARELAECMAKDVADVEPTQFEVEGPCRSELRNRSLVPWHRPWFVYVR